MSEQEEQKKFNKNAWLFVLAVVFFTFLQSLSKTKEAARANMYGAIRTLHIEALIREGDQEKLYEYIDNSLRKDLAGISSNRKLYIRPDNSFETAERVVDYFNIHRDGHIEYPHRKHHANEDLRDIAWEVKQAKEEASK